MDLLNDPKLHWSRFTGSSRFDYPIDYSAAMLNVHDNGRLDLAYRWAPDSYCHFHRHLAPTSSVVLEGELHVIDYDDDGAEQERRVRTVGDYSHSSTPDVHMELGGPEGAVVLFTIETPDDDRLSEVLARDLTVIRTSTGEDVRKAWAKRR